jgi:tRNA-specific 2-thiouridylase
MSGGVDSSIAAYLLKSQNYKVYGLHFKTVNDILFSLYPEKQKVCCSPSDTTDAIKVAEKLRLDDFQIVDIKDEFKEKIINYFIETYKSGKTPNPCILCNRYFKFGKAIDICKKIGANYISSGHYIIREYSRKYSSEVLKKGVDNYKDQSYFLSYIKKDVVPYLLFPLGKMYKSEIRELAQKLDLSVANKKDSQELCFIPDNDYRGFLRENGINVQEGKVLDLEGNEIGIHDGYLNYTIGQRSGIRYYKSPQIKLHVYKIIPDKNILVMAPTEKLYSHELIATKVNFLIDFKSVDGLCRVRKKSEEKPATVTKIADDTIRVNFKEPIFAVTPGQFATIYDENGIILASGIITS